VEIGMRKDGRKTSDVRSSNAPGANADARWDEDPRAPKPAKAEKPKAKPGRKRKEDRTGLAPSEGMQ
jgi:hypothetical protein